MKLYGFSFLFILIITVEPAQHVMFYALETSGLGFASQICQCW